MVVVAAGLGGWLLWPNPPSGAVEGAFTGAVVPAAWPPAAPVDLGAELSNSEAMRRIGAAGLAPGAYQPDSGEAGPDTPGLIVRTGTAQGLYYIEAVFGVGVGFEDAMPMALVIHGRGDVARIPGGPFWGLDTPLRVIVPQAPDPLGDGYEWLPVRVGSGLIDRLTTGLASRAQHMAAFLRELLETLPTVGRPIVCGFSQGGILTLALALHHSDVVSAAFPLSGWLPPALVPSYRRPDLRFPQIRATHGSADRIVGYEPTRALFDDLASRTFDVELVTYEGVGHEMTDEMNAQLHIWLREALDGLLDQAVEEGVLDGGPPPCGMPEGGVPEAGIAEWTEEAGLGASDGGVAEGWWWPCPDGGAELLEAPAP